MRACRLLLAAVPVAAALAAAVPARADSYTNLFQPLLAEMNDREADLFAVEPLTREQKRQLAALNRSFRALEVDSRDLAGDLRMAQKIVKALEKGYPGDFVIGDLLDDLRAGLGALIEDGRDQLEVSIAGLADGRPKTRAAAKLLKVDAVLLLMAEPATRVRLAGLQRKCWTLILQAGKIVAKGQPGGPSGDSFVAATVDGAAWETNSTFGSAVVGLAHVSESTSGVRKVLFTGRRILPHSENALLPGAETRLQINLQSTWADITASTFNFGGGEGVNVSATWTFENEEGNLVQAAATAGSVTITEVETTLGTVSATGTFEFTMYDGLAAESFPIVSGTFQAFDLPRSDAP